MYLHLVTGKTRIEQDSLCHLAGDNGPNKIQYQLNLASVYLLASQVNQNHGLPQSCHLGSIKTFILRKSGSDACQQGTQDHACIPHLLLNLSPLHLKYVCTYVI